MHRFFIGHVPQNEELLLSDPSQLHHIRDVLRLKTGEEIIVCDDAGYEYVCHIKRIDAGGIHLEIKERRKPRQTGVNITVACAIPKKNKMDDIIDKLTQLGVENIIPMQTARVIALPSESSRVAKLERWKRIARTASEQSQRDRIPLISPVTEFESVLSGAKKFDLRLILTLQGDARNVRDLVEVLTPGSILLLIGPEGDFTPEEVNSAREAGITPASLGRRILRVETAAIAATAYLSLTLGL